MTIFTMELIKSLAAKNKAVPIPAPVHNDFINKLITGEEKKECVLSPAVSKIISFFLLQNKALLILYDNGYI